MSEKSSVLDSESRIISPFRAGMPNLRQYFGDMRNRKEFVLELSRAERAEEQLDTFFGQLWCVISPLLECRDLLFVYFCCPRWSSGSRVLLAFSCRYFHF